MQVDSEVSAIGAARDLLQDALEAAGTHQDSDWEEHSDDENNLIDIEEVQMSPTNGGGGASRRARRRRRQFSASAFNNSYVMKLFDRSVDLAQFDANAPLYPVCRAWIRNDPLSATGRDKNPAAALLSSAPGPSLSSGVVPSSDSLLLLEESSGVGQVGDVCRLPSPEPFSESCPPLHQLMKQRHPDLQPPRPSADPLTPSVVPSHSTLMSGHLTRWRHVKKLVRAEMRQQEKRYASSFRVLEQLCLTADRS